MIKNNEHDLPVSAVAKSKGLLKNEGRIMLDILNLALNEGKTNYIKYSNLTPSERDLAQQLVGLGMLKEYENESAGFAVTNAGIQFIVKA